MISEASRYSVETRVFCSKLERNKRKTFAGDLIQSELISFVEEKDHLESVGTSWTEQQSEQQEKTGHSDALYILYERK